MKLTPHPDRPALTVADVAASAVREGDRLCVRYRVADGTALRVNTHPPIRTDELWKHTCFEAFVMGAGPGYREFNFAPSGAWAAYAFDDYRDGMRNAEATPVIAWDGATLTAELAVDLPGDWRLNLTAVIEELDGTKSYWALAHPDGPPDFHDPACFVLSLPARG